MGETVLIGNDTWCKMGIRRKESIVGIGRNYTETVFNSNTAKP